MRQFTSYGPVNLSKHYGVPRTALVARCADQLVGDADEGGHYFTIWAARQTGKTWLMRQAGAEIRRRHGDRFKVVVLTLQQLMRQQDSDEVFLRNVRHRIDDAIGQLIPPLQSFEEWPALFKKSGGLFDRPVILFIDEFDSLTPGVISTLAGLFRHMFLSREAYHLHGLALIGVRAVLGLDSERGSPFNVQRSLHVPNLTMPEVTDMFAQYQAESGQGVEPAVVEALYGVTRGQPGLVGWFGELLTDSYNSDRTRPISMEQWRLVYGQASQVEPNNTVLNLLKKARDPRYRGHVVELFRSSNVPFDFDRDWCNYLYLNGIVDHERVDVPARGQTVVCRFSSPFVQLRLYNAFASDMEDLTSKVPVVDVLDDLTPVFESLDLPALLSRYQDFLRRAKARGQNPWHGQPGRSDQHLREAVGHFHLYWWLMEASGRIFTITPEFPTGNGKVDLHIRYGDRAGVIEVKSFTQKWELPYQKEQAARYAQQQGLAAATLALFVPSDDEAVLARLSQDEALAINGQAIRVSTVAIAAV